MAAMSGRVPTGYDKAMTTSAAATVPHPTLKELAASSRVIVERPELSYAPFLDDRPGRVLDRAARKRFDEQGFLMPFTVFAPDQARALQADFERLLDVFLAAGKDHYAINGFHSRCRTIWDIVTAPAILDIIEDLIGPDIVAWGTHYFCKKAGDPKQVQWHQDAPYWPLTPARTVTVWLAIDDADEGNAAMSYLPGSHLMGTLPRRLSTAAEDNVLWETITDVNGLRPPVLVKLRSGQMAIHSDLLGHGSPANPGPRRRCGLTIRYCPPCVRSSKNWNNNAIICRGSDPSGHWTHQPRPDGDSPFGTHQIIGAN